MAQTLQMPATDVEYTPIRAKKGSVVHATSMKKPRKTACGKKCDGWQVALKPLGCDACKLALHLPCKKRKAAAK